MRYLHPELAAVEFLDKPISFDDAQEKVYHLPPPLIVVGSAGSGKTALTLEKLKHVDGDVLYVTQSAYLARNARDLYYASGFEREDQDATFLSYKEFIESIRAPDGREAGWREFCGWSARMRQGHAFKEVDAHQAFEEIRGVIAAHAAGVLSREDYRKLGVRQSIFPVEQRDRVYELFEKYQVWLAEALLEWGADCDAIDQYGCNAEAAFSANRDPRFHIDTDREYRRLFSRIVNHGLEAGQSHLPDPGIATSPTSSTRPVDSEV